MQKVMCIKTFTTTEQGMGNAPRPEVGDEDSVSLVYDRHQYVYYTLVRFGKDNGYRADHFAVLPDETADEMAEEEQFIYDQLSC